MMGAMLQDIRFSCRMLAKRPGFTAVIILTFALGIGLNTAIFTVVNGVVLNPLPFEDPDRLVKINVIEERAHWRVSSVSYPNFDEWRQQSNSFEAMAACSVGRFTVPMGDVLEVIPGTFTTADLFPVLGVTAALGRVLQPEDDMPGAESVVVLSDGFWRRRFDGDSGVIGKPLALDGASHTVVGVLPAGFRFKVGQWDADVWVPRSHEHDEKHAMHYLKVFARLKEGVSIEQAQAEMDVIADRLALAYPATNEKRRAVVASLHADIVGSARPVLFLVLGAVGLVLLIATANVANLLLVRGADREKEFAMRSVLGAGRVRLVRQLLTESLVLGLFGGVVGVFLAVWGVEALLALLPSDFPRLGEVALDGRVLGFALAITLLTSFVFGGVPALQVTGPARRASLADWARIRVGRHRHRLQGVLVVSQVALALTLLSGAGLLVRSFHRMTNVDPGFNPDGMLTFEMSARSWDCDTAQRIDLYRQVIDRVRRLPGVEAVAACTTLPWTARQRARPFMIPDAPEAASGEGFYASIASVSTNYFTAMGIPLLKGRSFTENDASSDHGVVIVNERLIRRYWPGGDPIGRMLTFPGAMPGHEPDMLEIVGVVANVRTERISTPAKPRLYTPYQKDQRLPLMNFAVKTVGDPMALAGAIRTQVGAVTREEPIRNVRTMEQCFAEDISSLRCPMVLLGAFAVVAVVLASVGMYGVLSYAVSRRTHEVGVRMALGAQRSDVLRLVVRRGLALTGIGVLIGLATSLGATRTLSSLLYETRATDPVTLASVSLLLIMVASLACYLPARRATKIDPMVALRYE
ncbi:MAG: ABC transporter permease [Phycisphaerales bacterium]|nr:MAG: ABC transporter permease [Phycisphaerales bacterium]